MDAISLFFLLLTPATYTAMIIVEQIWPARNFPPRRGWQWIGAAFLVLSLTIGTLLPLYLPVDWMAEHRLFDGTRLGVIGGAIAGFVVLEAAVYAWHRSAHTFSPMWRGFHQLHHSPLRVDIAGSMLFHPLETVVYTLIPLAITVLVLGLDPLAAAIVGYVFSLAAFFQHWNVRTPPWMGYILQRPESHCVHHRKGAHYYNFSDLPLWDIVFGTFKNPKKYMGECGFEGGADARIGAMLAFQDVNAQVYGPGNIGVRPAASMGHAAAA
ncbi:MAG TPA: sterol desaturase family protein [Rudaea sp.]|uniref:sterol desaturase family protein n=1 Tax=Rudaea sp. TaxID=2136325 RepID=UPI002F928E75